jgi:hypothetical protein
VRRPVHRSKVFQDHRSPGDNSMKLSLPKI